METKEGGSKEGGQGAPSMAHTECSPDGGISRILRCSLVGGSFAINQGITLIGEAPQGIRT